MARSKLPKIKLPTDPPKPPPPSTREQIEKMFLSYLESQVERLTETCAEWRKRIGEASEPSRLVYDLDWSFTLFESAAKLAVYTEAYKALTAEGTKATMETLRDYATREALSKGAFIPRSSSPCSNLLGQCQAAAYAKLASDLIEWGSSLKYADEHYGKSEAKPEPEAIPEA